jgi:hypothetical protein
MPMLGVIRLILDKDVGSARGDEDFFSVASTMPLVALRALVLQLLSAVRG